MSSLFDSGIRPAIDDYLLAEAAKERDYGDYWSASSAGYCMRKLIFERLGIPHVEKESDGRKQRVFTAGHIFHDWVQAITKQTGLSIAQELELQDEELMIRGHIDDLVSIKTQIPFGAENALGGAGSQNLDMPDDRLVLYDYKTQNSRAFTYQKGRPASYFHRLQVGTYMYMIRRNWVEVMGPHSQLLDSELSEARILKISKDDLRMDENQILWTPELEKDVLTYWQTLNKFWAERKLPPCTCHEQEGGFMAKEAYNPYFYEGKPCSIEWYKKWKAENAAKVS